MAALGWLTPRRRSATARSVLAGEASAEAARKSSQETEVSAAAETEPEFPVLGDDKAAAFFDLDNTVMQGAALFHFGRGLYKRKFFETRDLARFAWQQAWFRLAGVEVTWAAVTTLLIAIVFTLATERFLARTRTGLQLRALSQRPMAAELIGIRVRLLALGVWAVMGAVTAFALMIIAPLRSPDFMSLSLLVVPALAAALIGAFVSFRAALFGGVMIGVIEGLVSGLDAFSQYRSTVPFLVILAVLLWSQRGARWDEAR